MSQQNAMWTGKTLTGETAAWAGDGSCVVLSHDAAMPGFGVEGERKAGPAVLVQFNVPGRLTAWVPVYELQPA